MNGGAVLIAIGLAGPALVLVIYPLLLSLLPSASPKRAAYRDGPRPSVSLPSVSLIVAFAGGGALLTRKLATIAALDWPADRLEAILIADGPDDDADRAAVEAAAEASGLHLRYAALGASRGKAHALNAAAGMASGDCLVFSDLDAALAPEALDTLLAPFADPQVGGVCGQRVIGTTGGLAAAGQRGYIAWDSRLKLAENRLGAITSNDGKLYAIRRSLFQPVLPSATDDLYTALTVILAGARFVFAPDAKAVIPPPSWSLGHDFRRRRRVTIRSLSGLLARPRALGLMRFGLFGPRLVVNKLLRRLLPVFALCLLAGSALLAGETPWARALLGGQLAVYGGAALYPLAGRWIGESRLGRRWQQAFYACFGMAAMLVGVVEYLGGRRIAQWQPRKTQE